MPWGPYVVDHLNVTRHIVKEYGKYAMGMDRADLVSAVVPGVMGQTGMETAEIVRGIVRETMPGSGHCRGRPGCTQQPPAESYGADRGYRDPSRLRSGKPPARDDGRLSGQFR